MSPLSLNLLLLALGLTIAIPVILILKSTYSRRKLEYQRRALVGLTMNTLRTRSELAQLLHVHFKRLSDEQVQALIDMGIREDYTGPAENEPGKIFATAGGIFFFLFGAKRMLQPIKEQEGGHFH